ncbi:MAG: hypothetical protein ACFFCM_12495, partial [Promethearchaeota archaeon]
NISDRSSDPLNRNIKNASWSNITVISDGYNNDWGWNNNNSIYPDIAIDMIGNIHVVWEDSSNGRWKDGSTDSEIMYANYTSAGWSNVTVISDGYGDDWGWNNDESKVPSIAIDGDNNLHVVWEDNSNGRWKDGSIDSEIMYVNYTSAGWSNVTVISDGYNDDWGWNTRMSKYPVIVVDNSDNLHVVWCDSSSGVWGNDNEIMYVNYTSTNGWSNVTVISDGYGGIWGWNLDSSFYPDITFDASDNLHVVWQDQTNGIWGSDEEIMYANYTSAGWSNVTVISDGYGGAWGWNDGYSSSPAISIDKIGNIHVVWQDTSNGIWQDKISGMDTEIMYVNYTGAGWSNATVISDGYNGNYWNDKLSWKPKITVDDSANVHVVWNDNTDGIWGNDREVMYVSYTDTGWSNVTVISDGYNGNYWNDGPNTSPSIIFDNFSNSIHVVWSDNSSGIWKDGSSDTEIMYVKFSIPPNGITYSSDNDKSNEKNQVEADYSELIIIGLGIGAAILSALSIYHLNKNTNLFKFKHKRKIKISKKLAKSSQRAKNIISRFDNKDLLLLFESEKIPETFSFLKDIDLTIISDEFLNIVDKLGFRNDEKADFLKEMLYFSEEERNNIIEDIFKKIKSNKNTK